MQLRDLFDLDARSGDRFVGAGWPYPWGGLYGGHIVAQALRAASTTVDADRPCHSLRASFIRRGDPSLPVEYAVDRTRDGRSFATRRVVASQRDEAILTLESSFHLAEPSLRAALPACTDGLPGPDGLDDGSWTPFVRRRTVDQSLLEQGRRGGIGRIGAWMQTVDQFDDDVLNRCALAYMSDDLPTESIIHSIPELGVAAEAGRLINASLDHAVWFHRPVQAGEWHWHEMSAMTYSGSRGLALGYVFTSSGDHVATISQETLVRVKTR